MTDTADQHTTEPLPSPTCPLGQDDCAFLSEVAELRRQVSALNAVTRTDPLTGIANYRCFIQSLEQELERTQRNAQPTSLVMLDIDHFKEVNDTWGHEVGNQALVHIASLLARTVRKLDIPCRYGGEEFAVILPDTSLPAGVPVAERIRQAISSTPLPVAGQQLAMTVSLGLASYTIDQQPNPAELIRRADEFLYQAKQTGRNRLCHPEVTPQEAVSREEKQALAKLFGASEDSS